MTETYEKPVPYCPICGRDCDVDEHGSISCEPCDDAFKDYVPPEPRIVVEMLEALEVAREYLQMAILEHISKYSTQKATHNEMREMQADMKKVNDAIAKAKGGQHD